VLHDLVLRTLRGEVRPPPLDARAPGG